MIKYNPVYEFKTLPSTMDWLKANVSELKHGSVCHALTQTKGRGRGGNKWVAEGGNLYCSILLKPLHDFSLSDAGLMSFVTSLALYDVFDDVVDAGHRIMLKWPNDILIDHAKVSGILLETESFSDNRDVDFIVIGFGVNVEKTPCVEGRQVTSLAECCHQKPKPDLRVVRDAIAFNIVKYYDLFVKEGFSSVRDMWLSRCCFLHEEIRIKLSEDEVFFAVFEGIDDKGMLLAKMPDGHVRKISSAEVFF